MKDRDRKFFTPCFANTKDFIKESPICKRCQHYKRCKRVVAHKLKKLSPQPLKTPNRHTSNINTELNEAPEYDGFEYGVDY